MCLHNSFPPDIRVEKEVQVLKDKHEVFLLCVRDEGQMTHEKWGGITVLRVFNKYQRLGARFSLLSRRKSRLWEAEIRKNALTHKIDVIHVHDLPLLGDSIKVGRDCNIPVVSDLHENFPAMLDTENSVSIFSVSSWQKLVSRVLTSVRKWVVYEKNIIKQADVVIAVVDEARERLIKLGVSALNVYVIGNYASIDNGKFNKTVDNHKFTLVYAGGFALTRDLNTVIRAVAEIDDADFPNVEVILIGAKGRMGEKLERLATKFGVSSRVRVMPWMAQEDAEILMERADVGLVPHVKSPHTDSTIPHKLFQYMWRKLPVIVSNCTPLQRIVEEAKCGYVYPSGDYIALSVQIKKLYQNRSLCENFGINGHLSVKNKYNWEIAGEQLLHVYDGLENRVSNSS